MDAPASSSSSAYAFQEGRAGEATGAAATANALRCRRSLSATLRGKFEAASHHMLERKQSSAMAQSVTDAQETLALAHKFRSEDRKPALCHATLVEELFCQTTFTLLGPIASLWVVPICGVNGARITGFLPGAIPLPPHEATAAADQEEAEAEKRVKKKLGSGTAMYVFQLFWFVAFTLPMNLWIVLYTTGHLVLVDVWNDAAEVATNATTPATKPFRSNAQPTEILPVAEVFLPLAILVLRQIVISIKYAYRPRRQMCFERAAGRDMEGWNDDMLGSYVLAFPRVEAVIREAERAAWRAGVPLHMINLQFEGEISDRIYNSVDIRETTPSKDEAKETKKQQQKETGATRHGENERAPAMTRPEQRNIMPVRAAVKYAAFVASKIKTPFYVNPLSLLPLALPFAYRLFHGRPAFGESHFDKFVAATALFRILDSSNTMLPFASAAGVLFDRQRLALDRWFSMLVPHTVSDAREVYHAVPSPAAVGGKRHSTALSELPDLSLTPQNIYAWDMGRKALRKIGLVYSLRLEKLLAVYLFVLAITVVWMVVDVLVKAATAQTIELSAGLLVVALFCFSLIVVFFGIVFSGMYTNRQQKLHGSAVAALRLRVETVAQCETDRLRAHMEQINKNADDDLEAEGDQSAKDMLMQRKALAEQIKSVATRSKEVQRALKLVGNGIESESETQKIRILGMAVDTRMLEALMGLLSALGVTLWQAVSS